MSRKLKKGMSYVVRSVGKDHLIHAAMAKSSRLLLDQAKLSSHIASQFAIPLEDVLVNVGERGCLAVSAWNDLKDILDNLDNLDNSMYLSPFIKINMRKH